MKRLARWAPVAVVFAVLLAAHGWYAVFLVRNAVPVQEAYFASIRDLPATLLPLAPAWLPALVPARKTGAAKWITLICGAISAAVALSFGVVFALRPEAFLIGVAIIYAVVGALHLARYSDEWAARSRAPEV